MRDLEFVQRCVKGSKQAWDEFLADYSRLIYNYILSTARISGVSITDAEKNDIFQELILSLVENDFRKLRSFRALNGCSLASWLRQVTVNFTLNRIFRSSEAGTFSLDSGDPRPFDRTLIDPAPAPDEILTDRELAAGLLQCIERLDLDDRYLLELTVRRGLGLEQVREHLKLSRGALDMRKSRLIERLRDCFRSRGLML